MNKIKHCLECGKVFHITSPAMNAKRYCSSTCRIKHNKNKTRISIRRCAYCGKEYVATHTRHVSKFCCEKHKYYSRLESNLKSVRKYQQKYTLPTKQAWLGNSNLKSHLKSENWSDELRMVQNELKRLRIKGMK